jgi:hypothetical protein
VGGFVLQTRMWGRASALQRRTWIFDADTATTSCGVGPQCLACPQQILRWRRGRSVLAFPRGFRLALLLPGGDGGVHFLAGAALAAGLNG